jgi:hypothetical protein
LPEAKFWRLSGDPKVLPLPAPVKVVKGEELWKVDTGKGVFHLDTPRPV